MPPRQPMFKVAARFRALRTAIGKALWRTCGCAAALAIGGCARQIPCDAIGALPAGVPQPPRACVVDGCSMAPDFNFARCCDEHDARYWRGGSAEERALADAEFGQCVAAKNHPVLARLYYFGVRVGGTPYLPTPWRWGFGWPYTHGYDVEAPGTGVPACTRDVPASVPIESVEP